MDYGERPTYRGWLHQWAAPVALGAGLVMIGLAPNMRALVAAVVYTASLVLLLSMSATYHRWKWSTPEHDLFRRIDHACIFILIGGTYTAPCLLALPETSAVNVLWFVWGGSFLAAMRIFFWWSAPRWVIVAPYLVLGWTAIFFLDDFLTSLSSEQLHLYFYGGIAYTSGALFYSFKRPNPLPGIFGFHELFHLMTIIASAFHFAATLSLVLHA